MKFQNSFEDSTFKTGYWQNLINISNFIRFDPKCPNLGIWIQNFQKSMPRLKSAPKFSKNQRVKNAKNAQILQQKARKFQISSIQKFWVVSGRFGSFCNFWGCFGSFPLVLARFGLLGVLVSTLAWKLLTLSQHLVQCSVDTSSADGDEYFVCHATPTDHYVGVMHIYG